MSQKAPDQIQPLLHQCFYFDQVFSPIFDYCKGSLAGSTSQAGSHLFQKPQHFVLQNIYGVYYAFKDKQRKAFRKRKNVPTNTFLHCEGLFDPLQNKSLLLNKFELLLLLINWLINLFLVIETRQLIIPHVINMHKPNNL